MLLNEGKFINTEELAKNLYNRLTKLPELYAGLDISHVRPFRQWPELYDEFYTLIYDYKGSMELPFDETMKKIKGGFLIRFSNKSTTKNHEKYEVIATIDDYQITLHKSFFEKQNKRQRIEVLAHELMHLIQFVLPYHPPEKEYHKQPHEIEALSKDIVFQARVRIRRGKINNQEEAKRFVQNNHDFKMFPPKFRKKMLKKILLDLYYYAPINENLNEAKYLPVGNLVELLYNRIIDLFKKNNVPVIIGKYGGVKPLRKGTNKKQKMINYKIIDNFFNEEMWKEFEKLISGYDKQLVDSGKHLQDFKENFKLIMRPNKKGEENGFAFVDLVHMNLFKEFFSFGKAQQKLILHHELSHIMQFQFPIMLSTYYDKLGTKKHNYEKDPFELQAYGSELTKELSNEIKRGNVKDMEMVSFLVRTHPFYHTTSKKYKSKMFQKVMSNIKMRHNLPDKIDIYQESLNELKLPSTKLTDEELFDKIAFRKENRKQTIESKFLLTFFSILKTYNITPEVFINRYHKYVDGQDSESISIEEIIQFLRFAGKSEEHSKVAQVLRISSKRIDNLRNKFEIKLITPIKRIMRGTSSDKVRSGVSHHMDVKKRYSSMLINSLQKTEKVQKLKKMY